MTLKEFLDWAESPLLEYVRDEKNQKIGVMVAFKSATAKLVHFGWSKCKVEGVPDEIDVFDRDRGIHIAWERGIKYFNTEEVVDKKVYWRMREDFRCFMSKCKDHYTKDGSTYEFPSFFTDLEGK